MAVLKFNDIDLPDFVLVNKLTNSLLPEVTQKTIKVPGRWGLYDFGNEVGVREIEMEYTIVASDSVDLRAKAREFANWLYYDEAKPLIIMEEPDKTYYAKVTGNTEVEEILRLGQGTVTFTCYDPFAYGDEKTVDLVAEEGEAVEVTNEGDSETYPTLHFEFNDSTTEFTVLCGERYLYFGQPAIADTGVPTPTRTRILHDDCSSLSAWTMGSYVDGGVVAGTMISDGNAFRASDYGTGTAWHGPARIRMLGGGLSLQDFTVQCEVAIKSGYPYQVGRIEIYLLDSNGVIFGKMAMRDSTASADNPYVEARAGGLGGHTWVNHGTVGRWSQFNGAIRITRKGLEWEFSASRRDPNTRRLYDSYTVSFYDKDNQYSTPRLSGIQVHIGAYGEHSPVSTIYVEDIVIFEENTLDPVLEVPTIFEPGDTLDVDCKSGVILKNGESFYYALDPTSRFLRLERGTNEVIASPQIFTTGKLTFKERFK